LSLKNSANVPNTLREIKGPFSFVYYNKSSKILYFARDRFGRHSLLFKISNDLKSLLLTSVAVKALKNIMELPSIGIFMVNLNYEKIQLSCIPWYQTNEGLNNILNDIKNQFNININIIESNCWPQIKELYLDFLPSTEMGFLKFVKIINNSNGHDEIMDYILKDFNIDQTVNNLLFLLNESIKKRVTIIPHFCKNCTNLNLLSCQHVKVGVLFSGGLDSAILAALAHKHVKVDEAIDLINVAFEKKTYNYEVPDRITGKQTLNELLQICPGRTFNFIEVLIFK
jgi:asparagine synthetase B (glutamine-hydrolysing)